MSMVARAQARQTLIGLTPILMLPLLFIVPRQYAPLIIAAMIGIVLVYPLVAYLIPLQKVSGKRAISITFYTSSSEYETVFGKIKETPTGEIFKECPGAPDSSYICVEVEDIPFVPTSTPYKMLVLKFPEPVEPSALFDLDYIYPETGMGKIAMNIAYMSGVKIGEYVIPKKTVMKSFVDRLKEALGMSTEGGDRAPVVYVTRYRLKRLHALRVLASRAKDIFSKMRKAVGALRKVKEAVEGEVRVPIIYVLGHKVEDMDTLHTITEALKEVSEKGRPAAGSVSAWVSEVGQIQVLSTELEELRVKVKKQAQTIRMLERVIHEPPMIAVSELEIVEEGKGLSPQARETLKQALIGVGIGVALLLVLMIATGRLHIPGVV